MTTNYPNAIDEMFALFNAAWQANTTAVVGYVPVVRWPGVEEYNEPVVSQYFTRLSVQTIEEPQTTLNDAQPGKKRYTAKGFITVQLFAPLSDARSMERLRLLSEVAKKSFRGKTTSSSIWFRNTRVNELPAEEKYNSFNVIADYEYDDIG